MLNNYEKQHNNMTKNSTKYEYQLQNVSGADPEMELSSSYSVLKFAFLTGQ